MRMWMVDPRILCMKHLSGEHGEIHKHRHNFVKQHSIAGRVAVNAIEPQAMQTRHDELAKELQIRAVKAGRKPPHSPYQLPDLSYLPEEHRTATVDTEASLQMLLERCTECRNRYSHYYLKGD